MPRSVEDTLAKLKQLQLVDNELGKLREKVAALSLRMDEHKKCVVELEGGLQRKAEEVRKDEKDSALKELELKTIQEKMAKFKSQLNMLSSNKQYAAMMHEISGEEAKGQRTEDEALAIMDRVEQTRGEMDEVRKQIEEAEAAVRAEEIAVADEVRELSGEIRQLSAERQGVLQQLDRVAAEKYSKITRSKGSPAIVAVVTGVCQGCFMGVTKQTIARLWAKKELLHCPNCARLMYLEGEVQ